MASRTPLQEDEVQEVAPVETSPASSSSSAPAGPRPPITQVLRELRWGLLALIGGVGGVTWALLLAQNNASTFFAGLLPVGGGILVGRRIKQHIPWHAGFLSLITTVAALLTAVLLQATGVTPPTFVPQVVLLGLMALIPFPAFGVIMAQRTEQRAREQREQRSQRGGRLERPGRVRSLEDLRSLSLPQLGSYVSDLFRKHDFVVDDYRFERDNYLEFNMRHNDEPWVIRVTVDDKVKQGVVLQFFQRMRDEGQKRGVLITSMEFQDAAVRWARDRPIALVDGPTLLSMND